MTFELPQKIYLQISDEHGKPLDELGDCTWSHERINADDIAYGILPHREPWTDEIEPIGHA